MIFRGIPDANIRDLLYEVFKCTEVDYQTHLSVVYPVYFI